MKFDYQAEKLISARSALMLPHPKTESESLDNAYLECVQAFQGFNFNSLDGDVKQDVIKLRELMGSYLAKGRTLTLEEQTDFSRLVDELATWFAEQVRAS